MRPITLVNERYNQHLTRGSLIIEVGSSGNTLQEAIRAVRLLRVKLDDAKAADEIFQMLMGTKVGPRREFIEENATFVENLDL